MILMKNSQNKQKKIYKDSSNIKGVDDHPVVINILFIYMMIITQLSLFQTIKRHIENVLIFSLERF